MAVDRRSVRREELDRLLEEIRSLAGGYGTHRLWPFLSGGRGRYSEKKTWALVRAMAESRFPQGSEEPDADGLREFYSLLFYCALRVGTAAWELGEGYLPQEAEGLTFRFFIDSLRYQELPYVVSRDGQDYPALLGSPMEPYLAAAMQVTYGALTGKALPGGEALEGEYTAVEAEPIDWDALFESLEESGEDEKWLETPPEEVYDGPEYPTRQELERLLRESFPAPAVFCRRLERLTALFPARFDRLHYNEHIRQIVDSFLLQQDMSLFSDDEEYLALMARLRRLRDGLKGREES